ncbi:MAG TPA: guanylate kinase [Thermoanaerobaculia bacterium]|nr:guanylate kinase [Thermoanaerobaculia bacterium]
MSETGERGELFILSGPSGAGKTTLIQSLLDRGLADLDGLAFSVSHTTRRPRGGETDGRDYHFVDAATFNDMIAAGRFLEWMEVHGNRYGTSWEEVFPRLDRGVDVLLDIDVHGAEQVVARHPEAHSIFVLPPSYASLAARLSSRGLDDPQEIARRLAVSLREIARYDRYHYVIVNEDARRASNALAAIILEKRHRQERMRGRIHGILKDFQDRGTSSE